jgi:dihydrofolate reductase
VNQNWITLFLRSFTVIFTPKKTSSNNMAQVQLYIATSLDGYIARPDGNLDWLESFPNPDLLDYGYMDFIKQIGTVIMGRKTYSWVIDGGQEWPYTEQDTYVVTRNQGLELKIPKGKAFSGDLSELIKSLRTTAEKDIWLVGGGELNTLFLNQDLIDKMIITVIPVIIGEGIPLFPNKPKESTWKLEHSEAFSTGVISLAYVR